MFAAQELPKCLKGPLSGLSKPILPTNDSCSRFLKSTRCTSFCTATQYFSHVSLNCFATLPYADFFFKFASQFINISLILMILLSDCQHYFQKSSNSISSKFLELRNELFCTPERRRVSVRRSVGQNETNRRWKMKTK